MCSAVDTPENMTGAADKAVSVSKPASPQHLVPIVERLLRSRQIPNCEQGRACIVQTTPGRRLQIVSVSRRDRATVRGPRLPR